MRELLSGPEGTGVIIRLQRGGSARVARNGIIGMSLVAATLAAGCGGGSPSAPQPSDGISIGSTVPVNGFLLRTGQSLTITAAVSYRLETASSAQVGMVVEDEATNRVAPTPPVQPVIVAKGTGTASFTADFTVPSSARKLVVYFALFADGQTKTRTVDTVEYLVVRK